MYTTVAIGQSCHVKDIYQCADFLNLTQIKEQLKQNNFKRTLIVPLLFSSEVKRRYKYKLLSLGCETKPLYKDLDFLEL